MFTPLSVTSLNQGKDLAHWHIRKLVGEPVDPDIDRSETSSQVRVSTAAGLVRDRSVRRQLLAMWIAYWQPGWQMIVRYRHRKGCEISAA